MLRLNDIIGAATDPAIAKRLHHLSHVGQVEYITLRREDTARHRLRVLTDKGTECAIALARTQRLSNGAVLFLEDDRAIVVRMEAEEWLPMTPRDAAAALELGYFAGNMHWRVRFAGTILHIGLEGPERGYLERLEPFFLDGRVTRVKDE